jgi:hypothetical protein
MRRIFWLGVALTVAMLAPACASQKKAAETAMAQTEQAWSAIKPQAENVVPDEAKSIDEAIAAASAQLQGGDYKSALAAATTLGARVKELADALPEKTAQAQSAWAELSRPGDARDAGQAAGLKGPAPERRTRMKVRGARPPEGRLERGRPQRRRAQIGKP